MRSGADSDDTLLSRRTALHSLGGLATSLSLVGTASAATGDVVNVVDAGADPTGEESIVPVLEDIRCDDGTTLEFPSGEYLMDGTFRHTDFDGFAIAGDDATIVPAADYDGWSLFKLGTYYEPGRDLTVEGLTFDFSAPETGLRALQAQVDDDLLVRDVTVRGFHDSGKHGPFAFDVTAPDGIGSVESLDLSAGGAYSANAPGDTAVGPTGILVSPYHRGKLWVRDCQVGPFPDNGLYSSTRDGRVVVQGGTYRNSNVSSIRLSGDYSYVRDATVVVDRNRPEDENQRGIRLDAGEYLWVYRTEVRLKEPNGRAISVQADVDRARVQESTVTVRGDTPTKAITVSHDAGEFELIDSRITFDAPGQALVVNGPATADADPVTVLRTTLDGEGDGSHGRHAVRAERGNCTFDRFDVTQTGGDYRRGVKVLGDGATLVWGDHETTHIPVVVDADDVTLHGITSRSLEGYEALKLLDGAEVAVRECTLYGGVWDHGADDVTLEGNWYPGD